MSDPKTETPKRRNLTREECGLPKDLPAGIPVEWFRLRRGYSLNLPGRAATDHMKLEERPNADRWELEFIPQLRHFRVTFYPGDENKAPESELVHESLVAHWRPVARKKPQQ
jgi:hypothetical protein